MYKEEKHLDSTHFLLLGIPSDSYQKDKKSANV